MTYYNDTYSTVNTGTSDNDSLSMSVNGIVRGLGGDDTINIKSGNVSASGGSGDDLFIVDAYYYSGLTDITITGGEGKDTIQFRPDSPYYTNELEFVITDFSNKDVLRFDGSDYYYGDYYTSHRILTQEVEDDNIVIRDNASINTSSGETESIKPMFSVTLQGVSDISEVADAKFYRYSYGTLSESKTLGELFSDSEEETIESETILIDTIQPVTTSGGDSDTTKPVTTSDGDSDTTQPVTISGGDSDTTQPVTISGGESDTTQPVTTSDGDSDTTKPVTISGGENDTTKPVTISGGESDTTKSVTTSDGDSDTTQPVTTSDGDSDTTQPVTISGAIGSTVPTVIKYGESQATVAATVTTAGGDGNDTVLVVDSAFVGGSGGDTILTGPVLIDSTVEGGIGNTYYVTINVGTLEIKNNYYTYEGGYRFLQEYTEGQVIQLESDYRGIDLFGNNFIVKSSTGQLEIQEARDKVISYSGSDGNVTAYSYVSGSEGDISGSARWSSQIDILIGADDKNNKITGGYGSSSLWGGSGRNSDDTLIGGSGYNEFFYAVGNGNDIIQNASSGDLVNLASVSLSQITSAETSFDSINIRFNDGGNLSVQNNPTGLAYQVAEGIFTYNKYTGQWSNKS